MLTRFLGGAAACLGVAGMLHAQQPQQPPPTPQRTGPQVRFVKATAAQASQAPATQAPAGKTPPATLPADSGTPAGKPATAAPAPVAVNAPATPSSQLLTNPGCTTCPSYAECADACCTPCGPPGRVWFDAGYLYWTTSGQRVPPLVTAAPVGTSRLTAGALGQPGTTILYPNGNLNDNWRSGFYLNGGFWLDQCQTCGIEGNFFFLGNSTDRFSATSPGTSVITRPFFNTQLQRQDSQLVSFPGDTELVSFPGVVGGTVDVKSTNSVIGGGPNFVKNLCCGPCGRFDLLLGYSYLNVTDEVRIRENLTTLPGQTTVPAGTTFQIEDRFRTSNNFHGGNIGFAAEKRFSYWYVGVRAGVGLGVNHQVIDINGSTVITPPGGTPQSYAGGLLTQPSNIGHYTRDRFAVMPWVGVKLGAQLTQRVRAYVGYDFMALTNVARAGDQIDLRVNPTQLPPRTNGVQGPAFPQFQPKDSTFWGQGIRIGMEVRF